MKTFIALLSGILFGVGLAVSQMVNPAKVIGFLDLFGQWDPSLALVMVGALLVTIPVSRWALLHAEKPVLDSRFHLPHNRKIDQPLVVGSVLFGAGWGLVGYCPGPLFAGLSVNNLPILVTFLGMATGTLLIMGWRGQFVWMPKFAR